MFEVPSTSAFKVIVFDAKETSMPVLEPSAFKLSAVSDSERPVKVANAYVLSSS